MTPPNPSPVVHLELHTGNLITAPDGGDVALWQPKS
jgi:hypothetical protein